MSKSELVVETPFGKTLDDMFKFYLGRDIPICVPKNVEIAVSQDVCDELRHIKECVRKTYSLGIPTKDLDTDTIVKLFAIEYRHKNILCNILDSFTVRDYYVNENALSPDSMNKTIGSNSTLVTPHSEHEKNIKEIANLFNQIPGVTVTKPS